jgi:flagellar basal-body rod protein FlgG
VNGAFYIGATALQAHQRGLEVAANNIANMNSLGFKRSEMRFAEMVGGASPLPFASGEPALSGVDGRAEARWFEAGQLRETGNSFDLAVAGSGFIEVLGPDGQLMLWRGGRLEIGQDGQLQTQDGYPLRAAIQLPPGTRDLRIDRGGTVSTGSAAEPIELGKIELVRPTYPDQLQPIATGLFVTRGDAGVAPLDSMGGTDAALVQGSIELSNVELASEMLTLLLMQRAFGASAQVVQAGDQLMSIANNLRR